MKCRIDLLGVTVRSQHGGAIFRACAYKTIKGKLGYGAIGRVETRSTFFCQCIDTIHARAGATIGGPEEAACREYGEKNNCALESLVLATLPDIFFVCLERLILT